MSASDSVRVYGFVRTAHLERFRQMVPARVIFHRSRYDYDESLAPENDRPVRMSRAGVVAHLLRYRYQVVEINEPLGWKRWPDLLAQVLAVRVRGGFGRKRTKLVAYCIGHSDPVEELTERWHRLPLKLARALTWAVTNGLVRSMDKLAFGTAGSLALYQQYSGPAALAARSALFEALPATCDCAEPPADPPAPPTLLFVGAFQQRKGIRELMAGWDALTDRSRQFRLHLIGKGALLDEVSAWCAGRPEVDLDIDPPRSFIHRSMRSATALVLLSQRVGAWREQVGLPIVEGLAHGVEIVTTDETGLAPWLQEHGHVVIPADSAPEAIASGLLRALTARRSKQSVLADLPDLDQRVEADRWMLLDGYVLSAPHRVGR